MDVETSGIRHSDHGQGSGRAEEQRRYYNLVICSTTSHEDGHLFSDFMGYCMALREHGVGGDFFSCFPIEEHFNYLRNEFNPSIDAIKFGELGPNGDKALYTYSRHAYLNREYWWTQIAPNELSRRMLEWIADKQRDAEPGDVVNIFLEGRQTSNGIGDSHIHTDVFRDLLSGFKDGVQANAISGTCYSGRFSDAIRCPSGDSGHSGRRYSGVAASRNVGNRIRISRFSQPFVQSLAKVNIPGVPRRRVTWRTPDHEEVTRTLLQRYVAPNATVAEPHFNSSENVSGMAVVEEMIFRDKKDVVYDPRVSARRRRVEWPTADEEVCRHLMPVGELRCRNTRTYQHRPLTLRPRM